MLWNRFQSESIVEYKRKVLRNRILDVNGFSTGSLAEITAIVGQYKDPQAK